MKPRTVSFANGGPRPAKGSERTVDYKGNEHSKPIHSEFHHITSAVLIGDGQGATHREYNLARPSFWDGWFVQVGAGSGLAYAPDISEEVGRKCDCLV